MKYFEKTALSPRAMRIIPGALYGATIGATFGAAIGEDSKKKSGGDYAAEGGLAGAAAGGIAGGFFGNRAFKNQQAGRKQYKKQGDDFRWNWNRSQGSKKYKYFGGEKTKADVKQKWRDLAKKHHPDKGGRTKDMQNLNAEYERYKNSREFSKMASFFSELKKQVGRFKDTVTGTKYEKFAKRYSKEFTNQKSKDLTHTMARRTRLLRTLTGVRLKELLMGNPGTRYINTDKATLIGRKYNLQF